MPTIAETIVLVVAVYITVGALFAAVFVSFGVQQVDAAARGAKWGFRLIVVPGCAALWPLLLRRWLARRRAAGAKP